MSYIIIIILIAIILGWLISESIQTFKNNEHIIHKILSLSIVSLMVCVLIFFCIGLREEIRYNTLEDYFNNKIEVIQDSTIVRTYKFNNNE